VPLLVTGVFLLGIFVVPYRVALPAPSVSASWEFGFNNGAARELIGVMLLVLTAFRLFWPERDSRDDALSGTVGDGLPGQFCRALWAVMIVFQAIACAMLVAWYRFLPYAHYGEMAYFIQRLDVMLLGRVPFRDFHFDYGPGMIWPTLFLYRLTGASISIEAAYLITLLFHYFVGFGLIAYAVSQVRSRSPAVVFAVLAFPFLNLTMGLNYAPLRFAIAPASLLAVRQLQRRFSSGSASHLLVLCFAAFVLPLLCCAVSPEMGLALAGSLFVYFGWFAFGASPRRALPAVSIIVAGLIAFLEPDWFSNVFSAGHGGLDFPLLPTVHVLAMLAALIWIWPRLVVLAVRQPARRGAFCAGLATLLILMVLPATGRSDAGHVFLNDLALFLVVLGAATWVDGPRKYGIIAGFTLIFPVLGLVTFWNDYRPAFQRAVLSRRQLVGLSYVHENTAGPLHLSKLLPVDPWLGALPRIPIGLPLGADEATERYLTLTGRAIPEFYIAPHSDLVEPGQLGRKFADLDKMAWIYVPDYYFHLANPSDPDNDPAVQARRDNAFLSSLLLIPIDLPAINPPFNPDAFVIRRIIRDYALVTRYPAGVLLKRRNSGPGR
jgi:hypothetical protein